MYLQVKVTKKRKTLATTTTFSLGPTNISVLFFLPFQYFNFYCSYSKWGLIMFTCAVSSPFLPTSSTFMSSFNQHRKRLQEDILTMFRSKLSQVSQAAYLVDFVGYYWTVGWEWTKAVNFFLIIKHFKTLLMALFCFSYQCAYFSPLLLWLVFVLRLCFIVQIFLCILCLVIMLTKAAHSGWVLRTRDQENQAGVYNSENWSVHSNLSNWMWPFYFFISVFHDLIFMIANLRV